MGFALRPKAFENAPPSRQVIPRWIKDTGGKTESCDVHVTAQLFISVCEIMEELAAAHSVKGKRNKND